MMHFRHKNYSLPRLMDTTNDARGPKKLLSSFPTRVSAGTVIPPIHSLPSELVCEIFFIYAEDNERLFTLRWTMLMLVCKHWYAIGEQTTKLWAFIELAPADPFSGFDDLRDARRIRTQLSRAGSWPLTVRMQLESEPSPAKQALLPMFWGRALGSMELRGSPKRVEATINALLSVPHPTLTNLVIEPTTPIGTCATSASTILGTGFPQLHHLSTRGLHFDWSSVSIHELRTLQMDLSAMSLEPSKVFADVLNILTRCSFLTEIRLRFSAIFRMQPMVKSRLMTSLPHLKSISIEAASEVCATILGSLEDIASNAMINITMTEWLDDLESSSIALLLSYMRAHALKQGAPTIRTLAIVGVPHNTSSRYRSPITTCIEGRLQPYLASRYSSPEALLSLTVKAKSCDALAAVIHSWPLEKVTHVDVCRDMLSFDVASWAMLFQKSFAIRTAVVPLRSGIARNLIQVLRSNIRKYGKRVLTTIVINDDLARESKGEAISRRATMMHMMSYCAESARLGLVLDTVEVTRPESQGTPIGACILEHSPHKCDCDWSELYRDLRKGFIYNGVLHSAAVMI